MIKRLYGLDADAAAGIVAGFIGGVLMALTAMIHAAAVGKGFWLPMKLVAGVFWGAAAPGGNIWMGIMGLLIHLAVASALGLGFGLFVSDRVDAPTALFTGVTYGVGIWLVMSFFVLPWANPVMMAPQLESMGWWFGYHIIFGLLMGLVPPLTRAFGGRTAAPQPYPAI